MTTYNAHAVIGYRFHLNQITLELGALFNVHVKRFEILLKKLNDFFKYLIPRTRMKCFLPIASVTLNVRFNTHTQSHFILIFFICQSLQWPTQIQSLHLNDVQSKSFDYTGSIFMKILLSSLLGPAAFECNLID